MYDVFSYEAVRILFESAAGWHHENIRTRCGLTKGETPHPCIDKNWVDATQFILEKNYITADGGITVKSKVLFGLPLAEGEFDG